MTQRHKNWLHMFDPLSLLDIDTSFLDTDRVAGLHKRGRVRVSDIGDGARLVGPSCAHLTPNSLRRLRLADPRRIINTQIRLLELAVRVAGERHWVFDPATIRRVFALLARYVTVKSAHLIAQD